MTQGQRSTSLVDDLNRLVSLREQGHLTDDEFAVAKAALFSSGDTSAGIAQVSTVHRESLKRIGEAELEYTNTLIRLNDQLFWGRNRPAYILAIAHRGW